MAKKKKVKLTADLNVNAKGMDKARKNSKKIKDDFKEAASHSSKLGKTAMGRTEYRTTRSVTGQRDARGRNFSGMAAAAGGQGGISGLVGAYATLAANIFAVTAAFQALSDAAKVEQLTQGLELMGARGGVALKSVARDLQEVTGFAISSADSMRAVAKASSAGLGADEIARLGAVARGASVALGRDMSDSMDRLMRGAIKLEPELLDELGIMARVDEAARQYAKANNLVASSLTGTQKRQAFLNAILEEGEGKYSAIAEQIDPNQFDQLAAAIRNLGTQILSLTNNVLLPFVTVFTEAPFVAAALAMGIFRKSLGNILPTMVTQQTAINARQATYLAKIKQTGIDLGNVRLQMQGNNLSQSELNKLKAQESRLLKQLNVSMSKLNMEKQRQVLLENFINTRRTEGFATASAEYALAVKRLLVAEKMAKIPPQGVPLPGQMGPALPRAGDPDFIGPVPQEKQAKKAGLLGSLSKFGSRVGAGLTMAMGALGSILTIIVMITAAIQLGTFLFKKFFPPSESEKRLKEINKDLEEIMESAKKTRQQLENMSIGEGFDASVNNAIALLDKMIERSQIEIGIIPPTVEELNRQTQSAMRKAQNLAQAREVYRARVAERQRLIDSGASDHAINQALNNVRYAIGEVNKKQREFNSAVRNSNVTLTEQQIKMASIGAEALELSNQMGTIDDQLKNQFETQLLAATTEEERLQVMQRFSGVLQRVKGFNRDIEEAAKGIKEGFNDLEMKALDTGFTKINDNVQAIRNTLQSTLTLGGGLADLTASQRGAIIEGLEDIGIENLTALQNTALELGMEIDPEDVQRVTDIIDALREKVEKEAELRIAIEKGDSIAIVGTQVALARIGERLLGLSAEGTETAAEQAAYIETTLVNQKMAIETAKQANQIAQSKVKVLQNELKTEQEILAIKNKALGLDKTNSPFIDDILGITRQLEKAEAQRYKTALDISQLNAQEASLIAQKNIAISRGKSTQAEFLRQQISSIQELRNQKKIEFQADLDNAAELLQAQADAFKIRQDVLKLTVEQQVQEDGTVKFVTVQNRLLADNLEITEENLDVVKLQAAAERDRLAQLDKELKNRQEILSLQQKLRDVTLSTRQAQLERTSIGLRLGDKLQGGAARNFEQQALQNQKDTLLEQKDFLEEQKEMALQKAKLEKDLFRIQFAAANLQLQNSLAASKLQREEAIATGGDTTNLDRAIENVESVLANTDVQGTLDILDQRYQSEQEHIKEVFRLRGEVNQAEIDGIDALIGRIQTFGDVLQQGMGDFVGQFAAFGLSGQASTLFQAERAGIRQNAADPEFMAKNPDYDPEAEIQRARNQAFNFQIASDAAQGFLDIANSIPDAMTNAFMSIIDGTKSAGQAFKEMTVAILRDITAMILKLLIMKAIQIGLNMIPGVGPGLSAGFSTVMGMTPMGETAPTATGGIMQAKGYAAGGILSRRDRNEGVIKQPTYLVGEGRYNEAVVPLPNGRAIPVQMHGGQSNQQNNVSVNINMESSGNVQTQSSGNDMQNLGAIIASAVQKELVAQKMPGGILNRYGAA